MSRTGEYTTPLKGVPYYQNIGVIKAADPKGSLFCVGEIRYERFDDQNFQYVVIPYWEQINHLPLQIFSGIPGFDLSVKQDQYYRVNITPTFIQMRTPSESREDLWELLDEVGLDYYDRFEWMLRSEKHCGDDNLVVVRKRRKKLYDINSEKIDLNDLQPGDQVILNKLSDIVSGKNDFNDCVYRLLANGAEVYLENEKRWFRTAERMTMLYLLFQMMEYAGNYRSIKQERGIRQAKLEGKYKGRKRISVDPLQLQTVVKQFKAGEIEEQDAMDILGISRSTFYRRMRELEQ